MSVTVLGLSGLTKAYTSVLSATGSFEICGASRCDDMVGSPRLRGWPSPVRGRRWNWQHARARQPDRQPSADPPPGPFRRVRKLYGAAAAVGSPAPKAP